MGGLPYAAKTFQFGVFLDMRRGSHMPASFTANMSFKFNSSKIQQHASNVYHTSFSAIVKLVQKYLQTNKLPFIIRSIQHRKFDATTQHGEFYVITKGLPAIQGFPN